MPEVGPNPNSFWAQEALRKAQQDAAAQGSELSEADLLALLSGGQGSDIREFGGNLYRIGPSGQPELLLQGPGPQGRQPQYTVDERTGQVVPMTPGAQVGFAGIDPREKYSNELQQTGFSNQMQQRAQALNELENAQANVIRMAQMAEEAKMGRAQLGESRANRGEQARQANLRAAVDQWQTAMNLIPALGQLSLQESERVQGILSTGGDFLARAFESRGGTSPLGKVTQADQINALGQSMQTLRNMVQTNMAPVSSQYGDTSQDIGAYEAPQMSQGFSGAGSAMPQTPNFSISPAPAPTPAPAGDGGGGGLAAPTPTASPDFQKMLQTIQMVDSATKRFKGFGQATPGVTDISQSSGDFGVPGGGLPPGGGGGGGGSWSELPAKPLGTMGYQSGFTPYGQGGGDLVNRIKGMFGGRRGGGSYAEGGFTTEPMFLGNEEGAELFVNPTNAPIQILPADDTKQMGFSKGTTPGYDEGTSGWDQTIRPRPTGGFWNSFQEALEPLNAGAAQARDVWEADLDTDPGMMAMSLFGGPSGGGGVNMGKGFSQKIDPKLIQKAMAEFRAAQIAKRIAQMADEEVPGFATGTISAYNQTGAPKPVMGDQYYGQSAGFTRGATSPLAGMGGAPVIPGPGSNFGAGVFGHTAGTPQPYDNAAQMRKSFAEADFYKKHGRMPNPGELNSFMNPQAAYKPITQKELIQMGRASLPPAAGDVLGDRAVRPVTALESQAVPGNFLKTITARQMQALSPEETQALGTMTNTEYNAPLSYVLGRTRAQYGPSQEMRRGFLRGAL